MDIIRSPPAAVDHQCPDGSAPEMQISRATCALKKIKDIALPSLRWPGWRRKATEPLPLTLDTVNSSSDTISTGSLTSKTDEEPKSIFYLAYGSNLAASTFEGRRGCKPIQAINVAVPTLRLTFDLSGLPYTEPCFANTALRDPTASASLSTTPQSSLHTEKSPLLSTPPPDYHKNHWTKPMVGVVYELTPSDYYNVIATEGGGASYQDVIVECFPLLPSEDTVPMHPTTRPISAHTLFAPALSTPPPDKPGNGNGGRFVRPDPNYAQPSARYLGLITDGAAEHNLPRDYRDYLAQIRPYTLTTQGQRLGQLVFMSIWAPLLTFVFGVQGLFADEKGRSPDWLVQMLAAMFVGMWKSYDSFFKPMFGDGERSIPDGGGVSDEEGDGSVEAQGRRRRFVGKAAQMGFIVDEKQSGECV